MNFLPRSTDFFHRRAHKVLLFVSIVLLISQFSWPAVVVWWRLPRPGKVGVDRFDSSALSKDFLIYLPRTHRRGQTWPLVVFLHGSGERGNDVAVLQDLEPFKLRLPAVVAAPQCLPDCNWDPVAVAQFIEYVASEYSVDRERIYLVGYSMGGYGTWRTAAAHPELFAAIVPICGSGEPDSASKLVAISIWAFHGAVDKTVPVTQTERMIRAVQDAGGQPRLSVLPKAGHDICGNVCGRTDLWKWLFKQQRSQ